MGIFDSKEQVLDIQLTQYGKRLLQAGTFLPAFYSFGDEDIVYDANYGGITENQNDIQERILNNSLQLEPQYVYQGVETEFKNNNSIGTFNLQPEVDKTYNSISVLGNSQANKEYRPSWKLLLAAGLISSSHPTITGSISDIRIPQLNLEQITYNTYFYKGLDAEIKEQLELQNYETIASENEFKQLFDGSLLEVVNQDIFIHLEEINSLFQNDNFELEIFMVENKNIIGAPTGSSREVLTPLFFNQKPFVRDDIYNDEEFFTTETGELIDDTMVEYYFNVEVDSEIPPEILCRYVPQERKRGIYGKYRECPDRRIQLRKTYESDLVEIEEPCDD